MDNTNKELIKCLQINLRSKSATSNAIEIADKYKIDIILAQEPYFINDKVCGFPLSPRTYCSSAGDRPKSAIILLNNQIKSINIVSFSKHNLNVCNIELNNSTITLMSAYCVPLGLSFSLSLSDCLSVSQSLSLSLSLSLSVSLSFCLSLSLSLSVFLSLCLFLS